ncbi:MAG TPA: methyltransferase domain-containing protein [Gemmata sp.]|nr:methyltransferase domain-containing protein [Gemmata sp.]
MTIPDWQLPPGVDRGLWDYLHAADMVAGYDEQVRSSPLAAADVMFCEKAFPVPGRLVDLGCGTGRLCIHFAAKGYDCVGVDLSEEMLAKAQEKAALTPQPPLPEGEEERAWLAHRQTPRLFLPLSPGERGLGGEGDQHERGPRGEGEALMRGSASFVKSNLTDLSELPSASFDYAACLFSTLGMIRGTENRAKVIMNAFRLLKPGGQFVLHIHNRYFRGLGWKRVFGQAAKSLVGQAGDITMPQAYGGAPLTLHHFTKREALWLLQGSGFAVREVLALGIDGQIAWPWWRVYGWLIQAERLNFSQA